MSLYAIGDLHLSLSVNKSMDIFEGWNNYVSRIKSNWIDKISNDDVIVLAGDTSWGMNFEQALEDFRFIENLPGKKILLKGNHDYWWATKSKIESFFKENNFNSMSILHNNHYKYGEYAICGSRGWINETGEPADAKVLAREAMRLEASVISAEKEGLKPLIFLHYPPIYGSDYNYSILDVLYRHNIKQCYYGHVHGKGINYSVNGCRDNISFSLISSDFLQFIPKLILV